MEIKVNDKSFVIDDNTTMSELIKTLYTDNQTGAGIAVAVNGSLVPKKEWDNYVIIPSCDIVIIKAAYGG
ncbi:MAG: sulfur carrier protein ThiS [Muribaculaceae bacterium]|nr:sulfur carrier protein ThiS [Muribaculaceae bacterium]MDE5857280.1 sulfur carrier protein ThiS [Muribaculaceae bacterium]MDE7155104.1 sulfur carrier protein ThiS [Muribaculaceae bacterium]MDE7369181.1 sulfur carrier protein ThiS [Muribaculaceae bacterium]